MVYNNSFMKKRDCSCFLSLILTSGVAIFVRFPRLCLREVVIVIPDDLVGDENASACDRAFFEPFRRMGVKDIKTIHRSVAAF